MAAALPPDHDPLDSEPTDDRWDFEPASDESFRFDAQDDRKWDVFLLDEGDCPPRLDEFFLGH